MTSRVTVSRPWITNFSGRCASCGEWYREGTSLRFVDDEMMHAECGAGALCFKEIVT